MAIVSEFDGVADQVGHDLADARFVSTIRARRLRVDIDPKIEPFLGREGADSVSRALDQVVETEFFRGKPDLAGFDFR